MVLVGFKIETNCRQDPEEHGDFTRRQVWIDLDDTQTRSTRAKMLAATHTGRHNLLLHDEEIY